MLDFEREANLASQIRRAGRSKLVVLSSNGQLARVNRRQAMAMP